MFIHNINPVLLNLGPFEIRYYGLFIVISVTIIYFLMKHLVKRKHIDLTTSELQDLFLWGLIGVFAGSRVAYVFIYNWNHYSQHLIEVLMFWQGGLSFHGGITGLVAGVYLFCRYKKKDFWQIADIIAIPAAIALIFGRIANFLNGELVGIETNLPWGVNFHGETDAVGNLVFRHPSQLYESFKNVIIFSTLWFLKDKKFKHGTFFALFVLMYSFLRFFVGFIRAPDPQVGYLAFHLTMGQYLNILMFGIGIAMIIYVNKKN